MTDQQNTTDQQNNQQPAQKPAEERRLGFVRDALAMRAVMLIMHQQGREFPTDADMMVFSNIRQNMEFLYAAGKDLTVSQRLPDHEAETLDGKKVPEAEKIADALEGIKAAA